MPAMARPLVQQLQESPRIVYDWSRNLYVVELLFDSGVYYFPLCPGVPNPEPCWTIRAGPSGEIPVANVPAPAIPEPSFGSDYGEDDTLSTTELTSEFVDYPYDYGRRYNAFQEGEYWAPNDEVQQNQMDIARLSILELVMEHGQCLYRSIYRHLKPGGWIDQQEISVEFKSDDGSLPYDHPLSRWSRLMLQAGEISGKTFRIVDQARDHLLDAGFVDVTERRHKVPVGTWAKEPQMKALGRLNLEQIKAGLDGWTIMPFMRELRDIGLCQEAPVG
ncbi:predicted protein [Uncinocarpus reesii 1704]|uniref:Uncharacterized protein n=1 Tax=Uncinocarpus reesii (strain UAMH 1704) TaxID=336963 RepID=C4JE28_UNCRE|nr:uncharacterized protein UREG_00452 [Uncinocarpus reesii 1704]EEP75606.1 predicted protein [Uncinocarpus reesii 1704]